VHSIRNDLTHIKGSEVAMPVKILSTGSRPLLVSRSTKARLPIKKRLPDRHGVQALSRCQQRIIALVALGLKNCEIATEIGISVNVVKNYLQAIYDRIGMSNRVELALRYEARVHEGSSLLSLDPSSLSARYYQPDELHLKFGRGYAVHVRTGTCSSQDRSSGVHAIDLTRPAR